MLAVVPTGFVIKGFNLLSTARTLCFSTVEVTARNTTIATSILICQPYSTHVACANTFLTYTCITKLSTLAHYFTASSAVHISLAQSCACFLEVPLSTSFSTYFCAQILAFLSVLFDFGFVVKVFCDFMSSLFNLLNVRFSI